MATTAERPSFLTRILPDRLIGWLALALLAAVLAAIVRGQPHWADARPTVWAHLLLMLLVLGVTTAQMWGVKGARTHRILGWIWAIAMVASALITFDIRLTRGGGFSVIHLLSIWVLIQVPIMVSQARRHAVAGHRRRARGLSIFALLVAGFFTFPFHRMLGMWLFG
ncbi:DUF2306 domain-containing protein [Sandaracinobacter neustonicus]|nr:hypothetical protein [Sandaracinobacter neustonicus]